jgi:hypothetical protein
MSEFIHTALMLVVLILGTGVVASVLAIFWAYQTMPDFDKDTILGLMKIFMGGAVVIPILSMIYLYSVKH